MNTYRLGLMPKSANAMDLETWANQLRSLRTSMGSQAVHRARRKGDSPLVEQSAADRYRRNKRKAQARRDREAGR